VSVEQLPWVGAEPTKLAGDLDPAAAAGAIKGDPAALRVVDRYLDAPAARALWGDLGRHVLAKWIEVYAGPNTVMQRGLVRFASDLRGRLAGPSPSALDLLLAERVVLAWFFAGWAEYQYAGLVTKLSARDAEHHLKRIAVAHRNLLAACRT